MSDKIDEIRKRYAFAEENKSVIRPAGFSWTIPGWQAHNDRSYLLAEVDRQRAEIEKLRAEIKRLHQAHQAACEGGDLLREKIERLRAEIERMKRDSDEACDESNPVQEPVAWRNKNWGHFTINPIASNHPDWEPLYTEQQTRQRRNALEGKP